MIWQKLYLNQTIVYQNIKVIVSLTFNINKSIKNMSVILIFHIFIFLIN